MTSLVDILIINEELNKMELLSFVCEICIVFGAFCYGFIYVKETMLKGNFSYEINLRVSLQNVMMFSPPIYWTMATYVS